MVSRCAEALLDGLQHHVPRIGDGYPGIDDSRPGYDLAAEGVDNERQADDVAVPAGELSESEHQRKFERITMAKPSWTRPLRTVVCFSSSMALLLLIRWTRLGLTTG